MIVFQSLDVAEAVYSQKWYKGNLKYKKLVILMILRSNTPCYLIAKGFSLVSFECFYKVCGLLYRINFTLCSFFLDLENSIPALRCAEAEL